MSPPALDTVLFGADPTPGIVAVEPDGDRGRVSIYKREADGITSRSIVPFVPWLLTTQEKSFPGAVVSHLEGQGHNRRIDFPATGWRGFLEARRAFSDERIPIVGYGNQAKQFLMATGMTLFKGMVYADLKRTQIDIETNSLFATDPNAGIFMIAMSNGAGEYEILTGDEREMLHAMMETVLRWDPDVIEGHNIYGFDLPYIYSRCQALGISLVLGRDPGKPIVVGRERNSPVGGTSRPFVPYSIYGRHVIDTYLLVQRFDWAKGQISSYGLKECAQVYKIAPPDRVYLDRREITTTFANDPELVKTYARQDVEETCALAALVSPSEFYQTQTLPDTFQNLCVSGTGEKLNSMLVREYLRRKVAIPLPKSSREYPGGWTEIRKAGVISPVVKTDVESLYPSIMLTQRIKPASDTLDIFLSLLSDLTKRRLDAKAMLKRVSYGTTEYAYWDGLQNSYKVVINSFYGYIGGPFFFNDYDAAREVTVTGQKIVKRIADELEATGSVVIEIDTDGVYFQPPADILTEDEELAYIAKIAEALPAGIRLAHDGRYKAMLSLKIKNYVLEEYDGHKIFRGSSLRSRADEPYGRKFLETAVDLLLDGKKEQLAQYYSRLLSELDSGDFPIAVLARRERVTNKMLTSDQRKRAAEAIKARGIKEGDIVHLYERKDGTIALLDEYAGDEDREYYAMKLYKFAQRLQEAFTEEEFQQTFPKPKTAQQRLTERVQASFEF